MNYQPTDYLTNLNLELESPVVDSNPSQGSGYMADLDLFSHCDFFDLDVFSNNTVAPAKNHAAITHMENTNNFHDPAIKTEMLTIPESLLVTPAPEADEMGNEDVSAIKRKRNTAASARFRVKKKLKEKQMEQQAKELQDKLGLLEKKVRTLEMENKYLRQLVTEKNEKRNDDLLETIRKRSGSGFTFTNP